MIASRAPDPPELALCVWQAAAREPFGVTLGASVGHAMCTGLAVIGGKLLAQVRLPRKPPVPPRLSPPRTLAHRAGAWPRVPCSRFRSALSSLLVASSSASSLCWLSWALAIEGEGRAIADPQMGSGGTNGWSREPEWEERRCVLSRGMHADDCVFV